MTSKRPLGNKPSARHHFLRLAAIAAAAVLVVLSVAGCRPTDTLNNIVYTDWATEIDYDNPIKTLKNAPNKETTTSLPKIYETESEDVEEEVEDPIYDEDSTSQSTKSASKTEYSKDAKSSAKNTEGKSKDADKTTKGKADSESKKEEAEKESSGTKQAQVGGNEVGKDASKDADEEPDEEGSIIAFGEVANIVCLLGGTGALWSADDDFLSAAKTIYAEGTVSSARSGYWSSYKSSGKTISAKKFKKLCEELDALDDEQRPAYLLYDGSVGCPITDDQAETLSDDYGITTRYFFLTSVATIKNAMNYVKKILQDDFEHNASERYDQYWEFHDKLLDEVNDGKTAAVSWGDCASEFMSFKDGSEVGSGSRMDSSSVYWTLLIDNWDDDATYEYNAINAKHGLGYSTLGYSWSPVSYYLQRGGVVNNAAARWQASGNNFNAKTTYHRYAWQMSLYFGQPRKYIKGGSLTKDSDLISNNSDGDILLRAQSGEFGLGKLAGEGRFPAVIVANSSAKKAMEADRDSGNGAYSPYYLQAGETSNNPSDAAMGLAYKSGENSTAGAWISYIGRESGSIDERTADSCIADSAYQNTTEAYDVLVNPCGYYSSWLNGSVESFLESAWAYESIICEYDSSAASLDTSYGSSAAEIVQTFYQTFYGRSLSNSKAKKILNGGYAD